MSCSSPSSCDERSFHAEISEKFGIFMNRRHTEGFRWPIYHSRFLRIWTTVLKLAFVTWFVVQLAAFSVADQNGLDIYLTSRTHIPFGTQGLLFVAVLSVVHFSEREQSRAARFAAFIVTAFATLVWFIHIDIYIDNMVPSSPLCGAAADYFCSISKASTILSIIMEGSTFFITLYSFLNYVVPMFRESKFLDFVFTNERVPFEDLIHLEAERKGNNREIAAAINNKNDHNWWLTVFSLSGYLIAVFSFIYLATYSQIYDLAFYGGIRSISLVFGFALALAAYTVYRRNRYLHSASALMSFATALQIWSFFIYDGRRPLQLAPIPSSGSSGYFDYPADGSAQTGVSVGLGLIMCCETLRVFVQFGRAFTFVTIDPKLQLRAEAAAAHNDAERRDILADKSAETSPVSTRSLFTDNNFIFSIILGVTLLIEIIWFIVQFVVECEVGLFTPITVNGQPWFETVTVIVTSTLFIFQVLLFVAIYATALHAERYPSLASHLGALRVNMICFAAWWLIAFPYVYALIYRSGMLSNQTCNAVPEAADTTGTSITDWFNYCSIGQGVAVLSCLLMISYFLLFVYQLVATSREYYKVEKESKESAAAAGAAPSAPSVAPSTKCTPNDEKARMRVHHNISSFVIIVGLYIWTLASIWETGNGTGSPNLFASLFANGQESIFTSQQSQTQQGDNDDCVPPGCVGDDALVSSSNGLTYSWQDSTQLIAAWEIVVALAFLTWTSAYVFNHKAARENHYMKMLSFGFAILALFFIAPVFVISCRFVGLNYVNNDSGQGGQIAGIIVLFIGVLWNAIGHFRLHHLKEEGVRADTSCGPVFSPIGYNLDDLFPRVGKDGAVVDVEMATLEEQKERLEKEPSTSQVEFHL